MGNSRALHAANKAKKDEFYTQLTDIEKEMCFYEPHFRGKTVLCNCDDPRVSNFFHFFSYNFERLELRRLITTCYKNQERDCFSLNECERAIWLEYLGDKNGNRVPDPEEIGIKQLEWDGDFRNDECIDLLKQADIVVTNPPFSLFREYVSQLMKYKKKFIIIGNQNAITYKECFQYIQENRMWLGASIHSGDREFQVPASYPLTAATSRIDDNGNKFIRVKGVRWFTNLDYPERHEEFILTSTYTPEEYPYYDNYDAIEVSKTNKIPRDYAGVMGVPITFLDKYNPEQFEIIGMSQRGCHDAFPDTRKYDSYWEVTQAGERTGSSGGKTNENPNLLRNDGVHNYFTNEEGRVVQSAYQRIFIRNKHPEMRES